MEHYRIIFSIPVHEKLEVVLDQLANILTLNPKCGVVLHLSPVFDYQKSRISLPDFMKKIASYGGG